MKRNYNGLSRAELLNIIIELREDNFRIKKELSSLKNREKEIKSEKPGYKWRWSDERLIALYRRQRELEFELRTAIPNELDAIDRELEYIKRANNGGNNRTENYYDYYDEDLYLRELKRDGYVRGFSL